MKIIIGLLSGLVFGIGLTISQMVDPLKVINFLDLAGHWDPSLAFVMGGALAVFAPGYFLLIKPRTTAISGDSLPLPPTGKIDRPLILGAITFGIGWGISGVCPGPAIANTSGMNGMMLAFIGFMLIGLLAGNKIKNSL